MREDISFEKYWNVPRKTNEKDKINNLIEAFVVATCGFPLA